MSEQDLVQEARALLKINLPDSAHSIEHALWADAIERQRESPFWGNSKKIAEAYARAPELLSALCDEIERLRCGEFICSHCYHRKDAVFERGDF